MFEKNKFCISKNIVQAIAQIIKACLDELLTKLFKSILFANKKRNTNQKLVKMEKVAINNVK